MNREKHFAPSPLVKRRAQSLSQQAVNKKLFARDQHDQWLSSPDIPVACRTMAALRGGPYCGRLTVDSFGEDAEVGLRNAASPASLLARAMDGRPCGVASSPALGLGKFWKALDSLRC